jgi:hypothetical protein
VADTAHEFIPDLERFVGPRAFVGPIVVRHLALLGL